MDLKIALKRNNEEQPAELIIRDIPGKSKKSVLLKGRVVGFVDEPEAALALPEVVEFIRKKGSPKVWGLEP